MAARGPSRSVAPSQHEGTTSRVGRQERGSDLVRVRRERRAVLFIAGDKAGDWRGWYDGNIPVADGRQAGCRYVVAGGARRSPAAREERVSEHRARMDAEVRVHRLDQVREGQGLTQVELAKRMHVKQPSASALEHGALDGAGLSTIRAYVEAVGGALEVVGRLR